MDWIADAIAGLALLLALAGYIDNRRRIARSSVAFQLEFAPGPNAGRRYQFRNVCSRSVYWLNIEPKSVLAYELQPPISFGEVKPGSAIDFGLSSSSQDLPDSIEVTWKMGFAIGRVRSRVLPFQPVTPGPKVPPVA